MDLALPFHHRNLGHADQGTPYSEWHHWAWGALEGDRLLTGFARQMGENHSQKRVPAVRP